eukprot:scaffold319974_cov16-Prasinocladus_malaysianus.AAC.1
MKQCKDTYAHRFRREVLKGLDYGKNYESIGNFHIRVLVQGCYPDAYGQVTGWLRSPCPYMYPAM